MACVGQTTAQVEHPTMQFKVREAVALQPSSSLISTSYTSRPHVT